MNDVKRRSAKRKQEVVLRLLKGESLDAGRAAGALGEGGQCDER